MLRFDCKFCSENVFDVVDIEHLDTLPRTWVCSGCGRKYTGELDDSGNLIVYQKGYKRSASVYGAPALVEPASGERDLGPEVAPEEPAEEPTEEQPEPPALGEWELDPKEPGTEEPAEEPDPGKPAEGVE